MIIKSEGKMSELQRYMYSLDMVIWIDYTLDIFDLPQGVYAVTCISQKAKDIEPFLILRFG